MNTPFKMMIFVLVVAAALFVLLRPQTPAPAKQSIADVSFLCNGSKTIDAKFYQGETKPATSSSTPPTPGGSVALTLSDGRAMTLNQTISADGSRYANADESFVFWGKGNSVLVLEGGKEQSYTGCIAVAPAAGVLNQAYSNSADGFSIRLASGYTIDESYRYQLAAGKDIVGVKFTIPATMATGTNLSADTYISVEGMPKVKDCNASLFVAPQGKPVKALAVLDGSMTYSVATSTGAAAGNRYEEIVYALPGTNPCVAVRYYIHYGVFQNYPAGTVKEFDAQALLAEFDAIRRTLVLVQ